jgi:hypothetical protein
VGRGPPLSNHPSDPVLRRSLLFGPWTVMEVFTVVSHLVAGDVKVIHMENLKPYFSDSLDEAYKAALVDYSQHVIDRLSN